MQKTKDKKWRHSRKVIFWIMGVLTTIVLFAFVVGFILQNKMPDRIKNAIADGSNGVYALDFATIHVNVLRGQLRVGKLHLIPDTNRYRQLKDKEQTAKLYDVTIDEVYLNGFQLLKFWLTHRIEIRDLQIRKPNIVQLVMRTEKQTNKRKELVDDLPAAFRGGKIGSFSVGQLRFQVKNIKDSLQNSGWLENINLDVKDVWLDSLALQDTSRYWFAKNIRVHGENIRYTVGTGVYKLQLKQLDISTEKKRLVMDSFRVIPAYSEKQWSTSLPYKQDRYDMLYPNITVTGIDFKRLQEKGSLLADSMTINRARINIYADKGMPEKTTIASNNFPSLAFQRLGLPITVNQIKLRKTDVYYKELNPKSGKSGLVFFKELEGNLLGVSNDTVRLQRNPWIKCHFSTHFLGKPTLTLDLNFNMADKNGAFNYTGALTGAPASFYNQLLEPIALARAEEGYIHAVRFQIEANRYGANVTTEMLYNDLKAAVLDASSGELEKKGFLSLFVNWLAIKTNNPSKKDEVARVANHYYKHPQEKTFFNLMWKAVYSGLKVNVGLPNI